MEGVVQKKSYLFARQIRMQIEGFVCEGKRGENGVFFT